MKFDVETNFPIIDLDPTTIEISQIRESIIRIQRDILQIHDFMIAIGKMLQNSLYFTSRRKSPAKRKRHRPM